jgi:glycerol-3-phosphate dehydrogenase
MAPHTIRPLRFVLPTGPDSRSKWLLRLGLFLYDHLGKRKILPPTTVLDLASDPLGAPLRHRATGFEYSDCWVDDARLVVLNALDAAERGASIRVGTRVVRVERAGEWRLSVDEQGRRTEITARALINAAGPWIDGVTEGVLHQPPPPVRLVKGSHIVVRKLFDHDRAYIFQARDGRVIFAIPYEGDFTVIGTTDKDFQGDLATLAASDEEIDYLCEAVSAYLRAPVRPADVVWSYAGVRSLYDDGASKAKDATRDYVLKLDHAAGAAPVLMIYGGKITTYRRLAEEALDHFAPFFSLKPNWTGGVPLPGGDFPHDGVPQQVAQALARWSFLGEARALRMVRAYGTRLQAVLGEARTADDLGEDFGAGLSAVEVRYLMRYEWARTADDVLWRRSKLGLHMSAAQREAAARFMASQPDAARDA